MANEVLKMGYDVALSALARQDQTLGNLRNRATALLSAATVATTLSAGLGLLNADEAKGPVIPQWAAISILVLVVAMGALMMALVWPVKGWHHFPNPLVYVHLKDADEVDFRREAIEKLAEAIKENQSALNRRADYLKGIVVLLIVELGVVVVALLVLGR